MISNYYRLSKCSTYSFFTVPVCYPKYSAIDLWAVGCFDSNAHVQCWIVGHVVSKYWRFITDETALCFACRYVRYFGCKSYEIFLFSRSCGCWVVFNYQHSPLLGLCAWSNRQCLGSSLPSMQQSGLMRVLTTHTPILVHICVSRKTKVATETRGDCRTFSSLSSNCSVSWL